MAECLAIWVQEEEEIPREKHEGEETLWPHAPALLKKGGMNYARHKIIVDECASLRICQDPN